jgi:7-carboxy-7-deazaguanine synthase
MSRINLSGPEIGGRSVTVDSPTDTAPAAVASSATHTKRTHQGDRAGIGRNPDPMLVVNERFGPTIQGEGPSTGHPCAFLRLGGCNLDCSWCDTKYTWDWKQYDSKAELHPMLTSDIVHWFEQLDVPMLVITGGEPLQQHQRLGALLRALNVSLRHPRIEIETNGTIIPSFGSDLVDQFNVSPKLGNSGIALERRYNPLALDWLRASGRAVFKFVALNEQDFVDIDWLVKRHRIPRERVYVMPEGTDTETLKGRLPALVAEVIARRYRLTTRLHIDIWGKRRGV